MIQSIPRPNLRICPLCKSDLIVELDSDLYYCPTRSLSNLSSHYLNRYGMIVIYINNYNIIETSNKELTGTSFWLYKQKGQNWKLIKEIPAFDILSKEQCLNKIKTIMVFS